MSSLNTSPSWTLALLVLAAIGTVTLAGTAPFGFVAVNKPASIDGAVRLVVTYGQGSRYISENAYDAFIDASTSSSFIRFQAVTSSGVFLTPPRFLRPSLEMQEAPTIVVYDGSAQQYADADFSGRLFIYSLADELTSSSELVDKLKTESQVMRLFVMEGHPPKFDFPPAGMSEFTEEINEFVSNPPDEETSEVLQEDLTYLFVAVFSGDSDGPLHKQWVYIPVFRKCLDTSCLLSQGCNATTATCFECEEDTPRFSQQTTEDNSCQDGFRTVIDRFYSISACPSRHPQPPATVEQQIPCICGDGILSPSLGEHCDPGSDFMVGTCRFDCRIPCSAAKGSFPGSFDWFLPHTGGIFRAQCPETSNKARRLELLDQKAEALAYCCAPSGQNLPEFDALCKGKEIGTIVVLEDCEDIGDILDDATSSPPTSLEDVVRVTSRGATVTQNTALNANQIDEAITLLNITSAFARSFAGGLVDSNTVLEFMVTTVQIMDGISKAPAVELREATLRSQAPRTAESIGKTVGMLLRNTTNSTETLSAAMDSVELFVTRIQQGSGSGVAWRPMDPISPDAAEDGNARRRRRSSDEVQQSVDPDASDDPLVSLSAQALEDVEGSVAILLLGSDVFFVQQQQEDTTGDAQQVVTSILAVSIHNDDDGEEGSQQPGAGSGQTQLTDPVILIFPPPGLDTSFALREASEGGQLAQLEEVCRLEVNSMDLAIQPYQCTFWDESTSSWTTDGCKSDQLSDGSYMCTCTHLTNFAVVLSDGDIDHQVFSLLTQIGLGITSAMFGIMVIAFLSMGVSHRTMADNIMLNLCFALFVFNVLFLSAVKHARVTAQTSDAINSVTGCHMTSFFLYMFLIAAFAWTAVQATEIYYKFVRVFPRSILERDQFIRYTIFGWGAPLILAFFLFIDLEHMITAENNAATYCWVDGNSNMLALLLVPMVSVLCFNIVQYIRCIRTLRNRSGNTIDTKILFKVAVSFFFLLGFTWLFGLLLLVDDHEAVQGLFIVFNILQGCVLFYFYFWRHPEVKRMLGRQVSSRHLRTHGRTTGTGETSSGATEDKRVKNVKPSSKHANTESTGLGPSSSKADDARYASVYDTPAEHQKPEDVPPPSGVVSPTGASPRIAKRGRLDSYLRRRDMEPASPYVSGVPPEAEGGIEQTQNTSRGEPQRQQSKASRSSSRASRSSVHPGSPTAERAAFDRKGPRVSWSAASDPAFVQAHPRSPTEPRQVQSQPAFRDDGPVPSSPRRVSVQQPAHQAFTYDDASSPALNDAGYIDVTPHTPSSKSRDSFLAHEFAGDKTDDI